MSHEKEQDKEKRSTTDPQEDEKDGNVFGEAFDKLIYVSVLLLAACFGAKRTSPEACVINS